jgi:adenylate kinase
MYNILMLGAQGSGKGTQAERLSAKIGIPTISVGHLFRDEIAKHTGLGGVILEYVDKGERVPDNMVNQLMEGRLTEEDASEGCILDGYPRTVEQQKVLDKLFASLGRSLTHAIYLRVSDEASITRLTGRWVCSNLRCEENYHITLNPPKKDPHKCDKCGHDLIQRNDDKPEAIRHRLELYHRDTQPLIDFYRERGILVEVNGEQKIDEVEKAVNASLGLL